MGVDLYTKSGEDHGQDINRMPISWGIRYKKPRQANTVVSQSVFKYINAVFKYINKIDQTWKTCWSL